MFERRAEMHQEDCVAGLEAAMKCAENAQKEKMRYRAFLRNLEVLNIKGKYLDVGAGTGNLSMIVAQKNPNAEITALEVSADMVTVGEENIRNKGLQDQINFIRGDAADKKLLTELGKFDLIYNTYSLHHWKNPRSGCKTS
jgi:ubiquinone/menaquinone biosynthesis C-methylase UbiE